MSEFGDYVRARREALGAENPEYSQRKLAKRIGVSPAYLSRLESGDLKSPSDEIIEALAIELKESDVVLFAKADRLAPRLKRIIIKRPELFAQVIESLDEQPDHALLRVAREVRDGDW